MSSFLNLDVKYKILLFPTQLRVLKDSLLENHFSPYHLNNIICFKKTVTWEKFWKSHLPSVCITYLLHFFTYLFSFMHILLFVHYVEYILARSNSIWIIIHIWQVCFLLLQVGWFQMQLLCQQIINYQYNIDTHKNNITKNTLNIIWIHTKTNNKLFDFNTTWTRRQSTSTWKQSGLIYRYTQTPHHLVIEYTALCLHR